MDQPQPDRVREPSEWMVDGNALAGVLYEVFGAEMTAVPAECAHCGNLSEFGSLLAFAEGPGIVLRCPGCEGIVLRIARTPDSVYLDLRGAAFVRLPRRG